MNRLALALAVVFSLPPALAEADTLNASRVIYRVAASGPTLDIEPVPQGVLIQYCGDADGCKLSLKLADGYSFDVQRSHLYLNESEPLQWLSEASPVAGMHQDSDGNGDQVFSSLWLGFSNCGLGDYDPWAPDETAGFTFGVVGAAGLVATCTLVIED